ncbi:MAG: squalene--hopene cyclase [Thermoleophilaceae bacterium]
MAVRAEPSAHAEAREALERAQEHLLGLQEGAGFWRAELETNPTMDAEDLLLREFLGIRDEGKLERAAKWIRSQQRPDGSWSNFYGGPSNLSTNVECYAALRLAGDPADAPHMLAAAERVREGGGIEQARVFTHIWLALFGLWEWEEVPALPPELIFLPKRAPLNLYDFACWARQTIGALTIVRSYRPVRPLPFTLDELHVPAEPRTLRPLTTIKGLLERIDLIARRYERRPVKWLRKLALARMERWVLKRQEADGSWGGIQPPWVYSLMALAVRGYPLDHPAMRAGIDGIERFVIEDGDTRRLEACQSPVWDTALAMIALADSGLQRDDPSLVRAADWILREEVRASGDWAVRRPSLAPGGWAFEFDNDNYPDVDDTTEVVMALRRVEHPQQQRVEAAIERALDWTIGMQSKGGGWGAFDADNVRELCRQIPFCDFGEVIDDPSADVTAHSLEMLAGEGLMRHPAAQHGLEWLLAQQEPGGSWFGRWGVNHVYGTGAAVPALVEMGLERSHQSIRRAVAWLEHVQNADGGWGEDCRSYADPRWIGRGESTPSQTAWALLALHAAGERDSVAVERGLAYLVATQTEDGTWDEPFYTGTGFPGDFYINYHLYRLVFPLTALGRLLRDEDD